MNRPPITICQALIAIDPTKSWHVKNNVYENITCEDGVIPTLDEIQEKIQTLTTEQSWEDLRFKRNRLLKQSDKYSVQDYPHPTSEIGQGWLDYRQALRDLPMNTTDVENPVWPTPPQ